MKALNKKLLRDMRQSMMQFLSIVLLCSLGTLIFAGLDGTAGLAQGTIDVYFEENNLAHFWLALPQADRDALERVSRLDTVEEVCARASVDMETTLPGKPLLNVTAYDGTMTINQPLLRSGALLDTTDTRGCLIQAGFADAHGLSVGDRVTVEMAATEYSFVIRGIVFSPEFICVTQGTYPNPKEYGYILINAQSMPALPLTQIVVRLQDGADEAAARQAIQSALPQALVLDRSAHQSTASATNNADMFAKLTLVFPIIAYAVAALIVLTTLTRMIDNQRLQIGTLKALGYPSGKIKRHYLAYALFPSLIGSVLGVVIGHVTLPRIIWALLIGQNEYPYQIYPRISNVAWGMVALTVVMSIVICLYTYGKAARETTAELLRPKPPKAGRRVFLERIRFLWRRLGFNAKMIVRNLLRNRMRTLMSFVGILCCNGLIIASFGLQDSVNSIAETHYTQALAYDVRANLFTQTDPSDSYKRRLDAQQVECIMEQSATVRSQTTERTTLITVVEDGQQLLNLGKNETHVDITSAGIAVTEKLAATLRVKEGDWITLAFPGDDETVTLPVKQIVYNNIQQGLYMQSSVWEALRKGDFTPTAILLKAPAQECLDQLDAMAEVDTLERPVEQSVELTNMLDLLSAIFLLLMGVALALAFVICYNMGLMNFAERTREYATLKVLGYHQREIRGLIVGENNLITLLALACSIYPGIGLTGLVLQVCQTESIHYPSRPAVASIVLACVITYAFSLLIQLLLTRKVRSIDMVEALKSVE